MFAVPADSLGDAVEAARSVLAGLVDASEAAVLHASNNVVVAAGTYVAKATRAEFVAEREYLLSDRAARMGAPTLPPVMPPVAVGDFTVLVWPRAEPCEEVSPGDAARTLVRVQQAWRDFEIDLPRLTDRFDAAKLLISSGALDRVLDPSSSDRLANAVVQGIQLVNDAIAIEVLHGEPHDRNFLHAAGRLVLVDFEASCRGPVEWDAAFFPDDVAADVWPDVDVGLVQRLRIVISATVSIYCWRHIAVRGPDDEMLWHARHHLARVANAGA